MSVYVNRILNLKYIKVIGFDMDYTLVGYNTEELEKLTHREALKTLQKKMNYPSCILNLKFDFQRSIVGLVIDKINGNLLQLSRYGKVKIAYHGLKEIDYREQNKIYREMAIDIKSPEFVSLDTSFAISSGVIFSQLVQLKENGEKLPNYHQIADDIKTVLDIIHQDDTLKSYLKNDFGKYVIPDPMVPALMEKYLDYGKKLIIITNSDYDYTKALLDYALNPYWEKHKKWEDVFDIVITLADKPGFFEHQGRFLKIDQETGQMSNHLGSVAKGIYQGGWFQKLQDDLEVPGSEILYIGDHIYGDVVSIKKYCSWRTALVLGDLEQEIESLKRSKSVQIMINSHMDDKFVLEKKLNKPGTNRRTRDKLYEKIDLMNSLISEQLGIFKEYFNPYWGEILRSGSEESRFAEQVEKYACIYMTKVSDLAEHSPKTYFRPIKRILPHEAEAME
ncbi:MAG: HAD-IG family 5'-nucleotidase [Spirochaetia bacterium]|jgi:HAD superfamily 5'-nucleotidase-like hydrolase|nr:HAD-IG family 5'-nucleotidase [Spirochaetia bacterium]